MEWTLILGGLALGLAAGILGGMFGIGGGLVIVPALILLFQFSAKTATGTSLMAQVLPVGLLGVIQYSRTGNVRFGLGLCIALGLFLGIFCGARIASGVKPATMRQLYGLFLLGVSIYFLVAPSGVKERPKARAAPEDVSSIESEPGLSNESATPRDRN